MAKRDTLDKLLARLNLAKVRADDVPLYEVVAELIRQVKDLSNQSSSSGGSTTIITQIGTIGPPGIPGDDGDDGNIGAQGPQGIQGPIGPAGAAGPITLGPMGLDGNDGDDGLPIPGAIGPQGIAGNTGATGPAFPTIFDLSEIIEETNVLMIGGSSIVSSGWDLIAAQATDGTQSQYDFINLASFSDILVIAVAITKSASQTLDLIVSTDNGSTFLTASGDYQSISSTGVITNLTAIQLHATASALSRTGLGIIYNFNGNTPKWCHLITTPSFLVPTTTPLNAIRVKSSGGATLNVGTIYVLGR